MITVALILGCEAKLISRVDNGHMQGWRHVKSASVKRTTRMRMLGSNVYPALATKLRDPKDPTCQNGGVNFDRHKRLCANDTRIITIYHQLARSLCLDYASSTRPTGVVRKLSIQPDKHDQPKTKR